MFRKKRGDHAMVSNSLLRETKPVVCRLKYDPAGHVLPSMYRKISDMTDIANIRQPPNRYPLKPVCG